MRIADIDELLTGYKKLPTTGSLTSANTGLVSMVGSWSWGRGKSCANF